jgi:Thioesterase-like superfamily
LANPLPGGGVLSGTIRLVGDAFYLTDGDRFIPQLSTRGPWDPNAQHAGPAAALVGRTIESVDGFEDFAVARFTMEVLRSIPLRPLTVRAELVRGGRRVQLIRAVLADDSGEVAIAHAWRIRRGDTGDVATPNTPPHFAGPADSEPSSVFDPWQGPSYFSAVEWRFAGAGFLDPGPAIAWMRMKVPLVDDETPSPLTRVLVAADSGNGISQVVTLASHLFANTELSVHLFREPDGEWICLDAVTRVGPGSAGLASSVIFDIGGQVGVATSRC